MDAFGDTPRTDDQANVLAMFERVRADVRAPAALRARIEDARPRPRVRRTRRAAYGAGLAGAIAAVALALALVLPGGTPGAPSLSQAAALGRLAPAAAPPPPDAAHPSARLDRDFEDVYFPNWAALHWRAVGQRVDHLGGRLARTVYYAWHGRRIAYTIVSAPALTQPRSTVTSLNGTELRTLSMAGRTIVTWRRTGHTCVLSGRGLPAEVLRRLAAWHAPAGA